MCAKVVICRELVLIVQFRKDLMPSMHVLEEEIAIAEYLHTLPEDAWSLLCLQRDDGTQPCTGQLLATIHTSTGSILLLVT